MWARCWKHSPWLRLHDRIAGLGWRMLPSHLDRVQRRAGCHRCRDVVSRRPGSKGCP